MDDLDRQKAKELQFYDFRPAQTVASIGAQCCNWEAVFAAKVDSIHFYLEDIDSTFLNAQQAAFSWHYYDSLRNKPLTSSYQLVIGNEKQTNLPGNSFDKVLIINSFHEFTFKTEMLRDISDKLKPSGMLYIDEVLAKTSGELHHGCGKRIYLADELISILKHNGYEYVDGVVMNYRKAHPVREIFAFRKSASK